jgi:hypothetical protein
MDYPYEQSETKLTEFLGQVPLLLDRLRFFHAKPPIHSKLGENLFQPFNLLRRCIEILKFLSPNFADTTCVDK